MTFSCSFRFSLRYRVALAFLMLGWLISMTMGGTLYWLAINLEKELIEETLSTELDDYIQRYTLDPKTPLPSSTHFQGYVTVGEESGTLPNGLQQLPLGLSHLNIKNSGYYVESRIHNKKRFFILYADKLIKQRENQYFGFLSMAIGLMTLLSSALGLWLAGRVISPVTSLAQQVSTMGVEIKPLPINTLHPLDEVGKLSQAIEGYQHRLSAFNERERAFTSDISHELRTPLAVIEGAVEVMLANKTLPQADQKRAKRIARAAAQMTRLTTALLALAREESAKASAHEDDNYCPVDKILQRVIDEHQYLLNHKPVTVKLHANSKAFITSDPILLYVVLANIIRNAYTYTYEGRVNIHSDGYRVVIKDTGTGMKEDQLRRMFDHYYSDHHADGGHGIGLSLVKRICKRYGWEISVHSREKHGTSVTLLLK